MIKDIFIGLTGYIRHLPLLPKLGLWKYFFAPFIAGLVLIGAILAATATLSDNLGNWMISWYKWELGSEVISTFGTLIGGILIFIVGIILAKYVVMILASPFMSPLSLKIESNHPQPPARPSASLNATQGIIRGLRLAGSNIFKELSLTAVLLILTLLLPFISPITAVLIFLIQAYYAGGGNMDFTLERYYGVRESKLFVKANRGLAIGNGIVFVGLLMLGLGFLIAPPLATMAVTPDVLDRLDKTLL